MSKYRVYSHALIPMCVDVEAESPEEAEDKACEIRIPIASHQAFIQNGAAGFWKMDANSIQPSDDDYAIDEL